MNTRKISAELQEIQQDDITDKKEIELGAQGKVYSAHWRSQKVAIKAMFVTEEYGREKAMYAELAALNIPNIVGCYGVINKDNSLVLEFMPNGDLERYLKSNKLFPWAFRYDAVLDAVAAVASLHQYDIIHRDIKTPNFLLTADLRVRLCDFGFAVKEDEAKYQVGSPHWCPPEFGYWAAKNTKKTDVYSLGLVIWSIFTRKFPFNIDPDDEIYRDVAKIDASAKLQQVLPGLFAVTAGVVKGAVSEYPEDRPSASRIYQRLKLVDKREKRMGVT